MILQCTGGPFDGAVYALSRETADPINRSTNRKPDGLWFDGVDERGRCVQHQYVARGTMPLVDCKEPVRMQYEYAGPVIDTGIGFESRELTPDEHAEARIKNATDGAIDAYDE